MSNNQHTLLNRFDVFGQPITFTDNGRTNYKSSCGGIASIFFFSIWLSLMAYYIQHKNDHVQPDLVKHRNLQGQPPSNPLINDRAPLVMSNETIDESIEQPEEVEEQKVDIVDEEMSE